MIKEESECVGCALPCIHDSCPYYRVQLHYCDSCGEPADIETDGKDYCYDCAEKDINEELLALPFSEKCVLLGIEIENYL